MTIQTCFVPELISKSTPARRAEAERRLATQSLSPKNVRRLQAFVGADLAAEAKAPAVKAARPTGPGSRGGDKTKRLRAEAADAAGPRGSAEWWAAYKASK